MERATELRPSYITCGPVVAVNAVNFKHDVSQTAAGVLLNGPTTGKYFLLHLLSVAVLLRIASTQTGLEEVYRVSNGSFPRRSLFTSAHGFYWTH